MHGNNRMTRKPRLTVLTVCTCGIAVRRTGRRNSVNIFRIFMVTKDTVTSKPDVKRAAILFVIKPHTPIIGSAFCKLIGE